MNFEKVGYIIASVSSLNAVKTHGGVHTKLTKLVHEEIFKLKQRAYTVFFVNLKVHQSYRNVNFLWFFDGYSRNL